MIFVIKFPAIAIAIAWSRCASLAHRLTHAVARGAGQSIDPAQRLQYPGWAGLLAADAYKH